MQRNSQFGVADNILAALKHSGPLLRTLLLISMPFPALHKLLLSTNDLQLPIGYSGFRYVCPDAIQLSLCSSLESLELGFRLPRSRPGQESRYPPPRIRFCSHPVLIQRRQRVDL